MRRAPFIFSAEDDEFIRTNYRRLMTTAQIATELGCSHSALYTRAYILGVSSPAPETSGKPSKRTVLAAMRAACALTGCALDLAQSTRRYRHAARTRQIAQAALRRYRNYSFPGIGAAFGVDHTTVLSNLRAVERKRLDLLVESATALMPFFFENPVDYDSIAIATYLAQSAASLAGRL